LAVYAHISKPGVPKLGYMYP